MGLDAVGNGGAAAYRARREERRWRTEIDGELGGIKYEDV